MIQKALGFGFLFVIVPLCIGLLWNDSWKEEKNAVVRIYLSGFLTQFAVFQLIAVPVMILLPRGMNDLVLLVSAALILLSAAGIAVYFWRNKKRKALQNALREGILKIRKQLDGMSWGMRLYWLIAFAMIGFQMYMSYDRAMFDGDDSYYVVQSVLADQTGVLNRIRPYTGLSTALDVRHAFASLPLWEAYVARMTGIHAAIVAHTLLPLVLIPLTYLCYYLIGEKLFGQEHTGKLPFFMILVSVLQIWGNTSIYTNATFFLMRTRQGKSVMANLVLLALLWLLWEIMERYDQRKYGLFCLLVMTNIAAAMMTSMGAFLAAMFTGIAGFIAALRLKCPSLLVQLCVCCIPNVIYLGLLVVMG